METKVNQVVVGAFVLVLAAAGIAAVLWLGSGRLSKRQYGIYVSYFTDSVSGLNLHAPVKYRGVAVGSVREIALDRIQETLVYVGHRLLTQFPATTTRWWVGQCRFRGRKPRGGQGFMNPRLGRRSLYSTCHGWQTRIRMPSRASSNPRAPRLRAMAGPRWVNRMRRASRRDRWAASSSRLRWPGTLPSR